MLILSVAAPQAQGVNSGDASLNAIRQRGELIVGVKTDYPPFGMLTAGADQRGFERDLAADLARRLGVRLRTVGVSATNRLQVLDDGRVDVTIATLGDTAERNQIATLVQPDYYASGVSLMVRPDSRINQWTQLRGQTVCATQGSYFNRTMAERYLLHLQTYANGRDAKLAVRDKRCVGWLFDNTAIYGDLLTKEWHDYRIALPPELVTPWAIAIPLHDRDSALGRLIGDTVAAWHRQGTLIALERKWGLPPSPFLAEMHTLWNRTDSGGYVCRRAHDGSWPVACRNQSFVLSTDVSGLRHWGLWLKEKTGINLTYLYDSYERAAMMRGIGLTLALTACCLVASLLAGVGLTWLVQRHSAVIAIPVRITAACVRMTPPLLQIYLLYFGLGKLAATHWGIQINAFAVVAIVLSAYTGAGIMLILDHQLATEASAVRSNGLRPIASVQVLARLLTKSPTAIIAALVNVTKATMVASAIAVPEVLSVSTTIAAEHGNTGTMMNTLVLFFILLIASVMWFLKLLLDPDSKRTASQTSRHTTGGDDVPH